MGAGNGTPVDEARLGHTRSGLVLSAITKTWPRQASPVVADVGFAAKPSTVTWLTGENGAGKTTLLRIAAGILLPDRGRVALDGVEPARRRSAYARRIGLLAAGDRALTARISVRAQLAIWARMAFIATDVREVRVATALDAFGLDGLAGRRVDRLSLGQRQRVRLAMAFLHEPRAILLDEPATSLDENGLDALAAAIGDARRRGACVVWCSPPFEEPGVDFDQRVTLPGSGPRPA
jgi:ABC-type multidrug transport system ATPase subunit